MAVDSGGEAHGISVFGDLKYPEGFKQFEYVNAGAKILELFQIGVVQGNVAVQVGALSYAGQLNFDIVADANLVPDSTVFANGIVEDLERLGAHERK